MKSLFFIGYLAIFIAFTLFSYLFVDRNFIYFSTPLAGFNGQHRILVSCIYFFLISIFFGLYVFLLRNINSIIQNLNEIRKSILIFLVPVFAYPAIFSYDIFNYIATSKVSFYYHENPYLIMPIDFINDPVLVFTRAANKLALYGIFWTFISGIPYLLSFGSYLVSIFMFKLFTSLFYFGLILLIWKLTKSKLSIVLFAANPLVIIETFISGHNDVVMMFFALLAVYLMKNKKIWQAVFFLFLSIFIKYATLFLVPLFLFAIVQYIKNKKIDWNKFYLLSFFSLFVIFILSFLREEIYPWYAIWPLTFLALIPKKDKLTDIFLGLSFGLMLAYIPYMYFGTYFGPTPFVKILLMLFPPVSIFMYQTIKANKRSIL